MRDAAYWRDYRKRRGESLREADRRRYAENPNGKKRQQREKYNRRRAAALDLLGGVCAVCGTTEDLQFDHIDPALKTGNICSMFGNSSEETLAAELELCQLLCIADHTRKTKADQRIGVN